MGSKARRTALSVAGLALASGASLALAAPASAATHAGNEEYGANQNNTNYNSGSEQSQAVSGTYSKIEKTQLTFGQQSSSNTYRQAENNAWAGGHLNGCVSNCGHHTDCAWNCDHHTDCASNCGHHTDCASNCGHHTDCASNCDHPDGGYSRDGDYRDEEHGGGYHWRAGHTRIVGFYRTYQECRDAARRGGWDNYDCDFTRRGYRGWHQSWNKWGANDWRCHGTWVLTAGS